MEMIKIKVCKECKKSTYRTEEEKKNLEKRLNIIEGQIRGVKKMIEEDIVYDKVPWKISEELQEHVNELTNNDEMNTEDKILDVFDFICKNYTYDDNLISYIRKIDDDTFTLPDWYGRDIDEEWEKNREGHNS